MIRDVFFDITIEDKPVWISKPYRQRSDHTNGLFGAGAASRTTAASNGDCWSRRTDLDCKETNASSGIVCSQTQLRLRNNHGRNCGCQNKHHDQEESDCLCAYHREPPFVNMEGSFCGAPNQSPDFSRHETLPLCWLKMFLFLITLSLFYNTQWHGYAPSTGKVCAGSCANRSKK
jgi:hypothetical protein